jgi:hypothetical protein
MTDLALDILHAFVAGIAVSKSAILPDSDLLIAGAVVDKLIVSERSSPNIVSEDNVEAEADGARLVCPDIILNDVANNLASVIILVKIRNLALAWKSFVSYVRWMSTIPLI